MKKGVSFVILFMFLLVVLSVGTIQAADNKLEGLSTDDRIDLAYQCLENKIGNRTVGDEDCTKMTPEEMIFSVMATGQCEDELIADSKNDGQCWPKSHCDAKTTSQAIWALNSVGQDTEKAEAWLLDLKAVPRDLVWYLQIDTENQSMCEVSYQNNQYETEILENKKVASGAGNCLSVSENGYWLKINPDCYDESFNIKCEKSSITNLLFREKDSSTIHVLDKVESAVENGVTVQEIESYCLLGEDGCDYEGTLWAMMSFDVLDKDTSSYIPYLITGKDENRNSFPLPFLYILTGYGEYETDILSRQINSQYWEFSNGKYFDTALALMPFQNDDISEKDDAINWLLEVQDEDGCWDNGNIRNNAFILYSLWQKSHSYNPNGGIDPDDEVNTSKVDNVESCESKGFFCMSRIQCDGNILSDYSCNYPSKCCDTAPVGVLCSSYENSNLCNDNQYCSTGAMRSTEDGQCCVGGICKDFSPEPEPSTNEADEEYTCVANGGVCETFGCAKGDTEDTFSTCSGDQTCCVKGESKSSYTWVWILFFLIVIIVVGIIYRDKLKEILEKMQNGKSSPAKPAVRRSPGFPSQPRPSMNRPVMSRPSMSRPSQPRPTINRSAQSRPAIQKRPLPNQMSTVSRPSQVRPEQRAPAVTRPGSQAKRPQQKSPQELDSVLKKLKEMSK